MPAFELHNTLDGFAIDLDSGSSLDDRRNRVAHMGRLGIALLTVVVLGGTTLLAHRQGWGSDVTLGLLVAEIAAAAGVAALIPFTAPRKPRFIVSDAWLTFRDDLSAGYHLQINLMNLGERADVLRRVDHRFYKIGIGFIDSTLTCGGKRITEKFGHVLPIDCEPRVQYVVEGSGVIGVAGGLLYRASGAVSADDYIIWCRLTFAEAKPIIIRASFQGLYGGSSALATLRERLLALRTGNKDPLTDASVFWR